MKTISSSAARVIACGMLVAGMVACGRYDHGQPFGPPGDSALGDWGSNTAEVTVTRSATHVTISCAFGDFPGDIALDNRGRFSVNGSWNRSTGPIQLNGQMPAQLSGQVIGDQMTFAIAVNDTIAKTVSSLGPVTVEFGRQSGVIVCPV
jgi:hypothetical protein